MGTEGSVRLSALVLGINILNSLVSTFIDKQSEWRPKRKAKQQKIENVLDTRLRKKEKVVRIA